MFERLSRSVVVPARLVLLMWLVYFFEISWQVDLAFLGIYPRTFPGLLGVFCAPMLHGSFWHLTSNTLPLLFLGTTLYFIYGRFADQVFFYCYFMTGILVWLLARPSFHLGASGLIYGLAFFLIFFGFFRKDFLSLIISIIVLLMYGGLFYGVFSFQIGVSWESHLLGAIVGFILALLYGRKNGKGRKQADYFY
ncbi:rhomboid family intramembrane serine protease [Nafulsella turpanensis]|uniref:rhomboid family intramembrane serine protease n=1 Tax=Nafulsella turpanensis TaxID=1265690 RepID=UPI000346FC4B|nr:rhomboid family intramembrane serine protease [Nafulsella turpanensis]